MDDYCQAIAEDIAIYIIRTIMNNNFNTTKSFILRYADFVKDLPVKPSVPNFAKAIKYLMQIGAVERVEGMGVNPEANNFHALKANYRLKDIAGDYSR